MQFLDIFEMMQWIKTYNKYDHNSNKTGCNMLNIWVGITYINK